MRARACLLVLLLAVVCAGPAKAVDYCVYLAEFRGTGCPVTIPPGQTSASANICIECPTSWNGVCKNFKPTVPHKIRGTDCVAYMDTPDPNSSNCGTCPSGLAKYKREVDDGFSVCSLPVDDGLDDDHDGLIDEEFCDGLDNDGDGLIDEDLGSELSGPDLTGVGDPPPGALGLDFIGPNPARTGIDYAIRLPSGDDVVVSLYDPVGRRVATLLRGAVPAGMHTFKWQRSRDVPNGTYFVRLTVAHGPQQVKRVVFLR